MLSAQTYGCLGIIRSLGRMGAEVHAVDAETPRAGAYSTYLHERHVFDLATATPDATIEYLSRLGRRLGRPAILFPTWDETSILVADHAETLGEWFIFPRQPAHVPRALADKKAMYYLAREHGVPTPSVVFPDSAGDVVRFIDTATFPVMLKGIDGNRLKLRTGLKMVIVEDANELVRRYAEMEDPEQPNLMLQEYIPGGERDVWMFNGYFNEQSDPLIGFTGRKLRQSPVYTGVTSLGVCEANDTVRDVTTRWMKAIGYRGILDIGYRFDARDGLYKVLDANPRIGATFRLFVAKNGLDVARALYLDLTAQSVPAADLREGRRWIVEGADIDSSLQYYRDGKLTIRAWATSLKGIQEAAFFARDDLAPFRAAMRGFVERKSTSGGSRDG